MINQTSIPKQAYTITLNGSDLGTIYVKDIDNYMARYYPGAEFTIPETGRVEVTATPYQLLEIKEARAHIIHD